MNGKSRKTDTSMQRGHITVLKPGPRAVDKQVQVKIGHQLRAMYDEVVRQGVPERFAGLLQRFGRQDGEEPRS